MNNEIISQINKDLMDYDTNEVIIADKYKFKQKDVIKDNLRTFNSQFKDGDRDSAGFKKYFKNIVKNPCTVTTKAIAFYPADIRILSKPGHNSRKAWLLDRDFKFWVGKSGFDTILRKTFDEIPIQGSYVWKKVKGTMHPVELRNFACEQSADNLLSATYVIEQHLYSPAEFSKMQWDKESKREVLERFNKSAEKYIRIIEWRGFVPESWLGRDGEEYTRIVAIAYLPDVSPDTTEKGIASDAAGAVIVYMQEEDEDEFPYREFHLDKIPGRWLGVGKIEQNRDPQIRTNEITNLRVKSSLIASVNLWQTRDNTLNANLLHDVTNGDVIPVLSEITRIPNEDRNIGALDNEESGWSRNRDEVANTFDVIRGERLPSSTTLGAAEIAAQMTMSYFDGIRRSIASQMKPVIKKDIIGDFLANNSDEHYIRLVGEDFDKWGDIMIAEKKNVALLRFFFEQGKLPTKAQEQMINTAITERMRAGKEAVEMLPSDFYKDLDYDVDIVITGQNRNTTVEAANVQMILQAIQQDETMLTNPQKRRVFARLIESLGLNISDFEMEESTGEAMGMADMAQQTVRGGGIGGGVAGPTGLGRGGMQGGGMQGPGTQGPETI